MKKSGINDTVRDGRGIGKIRQRQKQLVADGQPLIVRPEFLQLAILRRFRITGIAVGHVQDADPEIVVDIDQKTFAKPVQAKTM